MENTKICTQCGEGKEANLDNFNKMKNGKYGLRAVCRACDKINYHNNKEYFSQKAKENRPRKNESNKRSYYKHHERNKKKQRGYERKNKDKIVEYHKRYYIKNKDIYHKRYKENYQKNKEGYIRRTLKRQAIIRKLDSSLTGEQWIACKNHFDNKCAYCGEFKPLSKDHFIPLTKNGEFTNNNIIPACKSCNSCKYNKNFFEWYPVFEHYSRTREKKILEYLNYKSNVQQLCIF